MKMKNRIMLFITIITLIVMLLISSVIAANSDIATLKSGNGKDKIGSVLSLGFNDTLTKPGAYCIQKNKTLHAEKKNYTVSAYVEIDGNQATLYEKKNSNGETIIDDNGLNAQVAYILSKNQGYGTVNNHTQAQNALWHIANSWGQSLFGNLDYFTYANSTVPANSLNEEAKKYATGFKGKNSLSSGEQTEKNNEPVVDKTKKDELTVTMEDGFFRVGPFRWQFGGTLESIKVKGDNRELSSSDVKFVKYNGTTPKTVQASDISSGEAFYVDISNRAGVSKLTGLTLKTSLGSSEKKEIYTARIWFLTAGYYQNIIYVDTGKTTREPSEGSAEYNANITTSIDLQIKKVDDRDTTKPLVGVGFTLSTTIQTYDLVGTQDHYKNVSCSHMISGDYTDEDGNYYPAQYQHSYDTVFDWTQNKYAWVDHTMYLSNGNWSENSVVNYTDKDGLISMDNIQYPTKTITNENYKGESYTSTARIKSGANIIATEVSNPYYGYTIGDTYTISLNSGKQIVNKVLTNHQKLVKLSGYVWLDGHEGKETKTNNVYDAGEEGRNGIKVYLKNRNGDTIIKTTTTSELGLYSEINGGEYQFVDIDLDALQRGEYYVEFEYCGIDYKSVMPTLGINNGSKAVDTTTRNVLDSKFTSVNSTGSQTLHIDDVTVNYDNVSDWQSKVKDHSGCNVYARTYEAGYNLYSDFIPTSEEIRYVNLGLYKKPQADYALAQDLHNVNVSVNGKSHIYKYGKLRFVNDGNDIDESQTTWNVGVKFTNNKQTYDRAIYHADAWYEDQNKSNELKVYVTYKIGLRNESSYLGRINSIVDYCDNRYTLIKAGTSIDNNYNINGSVAYGNKEAYNNEYAKYVLNVNSVIKQNETNYIYLQFELNREGVLTIINERDLFKNVAEITSYTTFEDDKPVSVVDRDSVPGNIVLGDERTYEDDTDVARSLRLELKNARAIEGTVFEDNPLNINKDIVNTNAQRIGDGIFDPRNEATIKDIKVILKDKDGNDVKIYDEGSKEWKKAEATTDQNGFFSISGYIPGDYVLTYTWGSKEYKVQYYKGTKYDESRNQNNKFWYKEDVNTRKTDALDSKDKRIDIDKEMKAIDINTLEGEISKAYEPGGSDKIKQTSMDSTTPQMEFSVEYETTITDGTVDQVRFTVQNVDFGIIERAKQQLQVSKKVTQFKITLANGQVLADAKVTENGKLEGVHDHVTYMGPTNINNINSYGMIRAEIDSELIEGATLEATYEMIVKNIGEIDYVSDRYYYYGNIQGSEIVKVSVEEFIDYLDGRLSMNDSEDKWKEKDAQYLIDVNAKQKDNVSYVNSTRTYLTDKLKGHLAPNESKSVDMKVSKLLTSLDDNTFNNEAEITRVIKNREDTFTSGTPVKVSWTDGQQQSFFAADFAEEIVIIPSTGEDKSYAMPIIIGITTLVVLGAGVFGIKKFIIDNK